MNKIRVIDLLNKIANGEEVPKKIKVLFNVFEFDEDNYNYKNIDESLDNLLRHLAFYKGIVLNDDVEIIEDTPKEDKKIEKVNRGCIAGENLRNIDWHILDKLDEIIYRLNGEDNESN